MAENDSSWIAAVKRMKVSSLVETFERTLPSDLAQMYTETLPIPEDPKSLLAWLTMRLTDCGFDHPVTTGLYCDYVLTTRDYDLDHDPGEGWMRVQDFLARWETSLPELISVHFFLPIYLWKTAGAPDRINDKINRSSEISNFLKDPHSWIDINLQERPRIWMSLPLWWWCKKEHIEFYEKLEHEKFIRTWKVPDLIKNVTELPITQKWLSVREVEARWPGISPSKLESLIKDEILFLYGLSPEKGIHRINSKQSGLLKTSDIKLYEKKHPSVLKRKKAKSRRVEENPNFERAIDFAKRVKGKYRRINMDDLACVTYLVLTYGDRQFDDDQLPEADDTLEEKYAGARGLKREMFIGKRKPKQSTVRSWFRRKDAFPHPPGKPSTANR